MTKGWLNDDFDVPGDITAGGIENTPIGDTTASTIKGTTGEFSSNVQIDGNILDSNGNEALEITTTASAVNHIKIVNAPTLNAPSVESDGSDTNLDLKLASKGTGKLRLFTNGNVALSINSSGYIQYALMPIMSQQLAANRNNVTGNNTAYTVVWGSSIYDIGSNFDGTSTYTVPTTGYYEVTINLLYSNIPNFIALQTYSYKNGSVRNYHFQQSCTAYMPNANTTYQTISTKLEKFTAADTLTVRAYANGVGADTVDLPNGTSCEFQIKFIGLT